MCLEVSRAHFHLSQLGQPLDMSRWLTWSSSSRAASAALDLTPSPTGTTCTSWRQRAQGPSISRRQTDSVLLCMYFCIPGLPCLPLPWSAHASALGRAQTYYSPPRCLDASDIVSKNRSRAERAASALLCPPNVKTCTFAPFLPFSFALFGCGIYKVLPHCLKPTSAPPPPTPVRLTLR